MQVLALATAALAQGTGVRHHAAPTGCAPSRWTATRTTPATGSTRSAGTAPGATASARGLPPEPDNEDKWPYAKPLLADPALVPDCAAINTADARYAELLRIRASSPVFGLATAEQVQKRVAFPLSGAQETPGVLTMTLDARGLDGRVEVADRRLQRTPSAADADGDRAARRGRGTAPGAGRTRPTRRCVPPRSTGRPARSPCRRAAWRSSSRSDVNRPPSASRGRGPVR